MQQVAADDNLDQLDLNAKLDKANIELGFLNEIKEPARICENQQAYETIFFIKKLVRNRVFRRKTKNWSIFVDNSTDSLFANLLSHLAEISPEFSYDRGERVARVKANVETSLNERRISILEYIIDILNDIIKCENEMTVKFCKNFIREKGLEAVMSFFKQEKFLTTKPSNKYNINKLMLCTVDFLCRLTELDDLDKAQWARLRVIETLNDYNDTKFDYKSIKIITGHGKKPEQPMPNILTDKIRLIEKNLLSKSVSDVLAGFNDELLKTNMDLLSSASKVYTSESVFSDIQIIHRYLFKRTFNNIKLFLSFNFDHMVSNLFKHLIPLIIKQLNSASQRESSAQPQPPTAKQVSLMDRYLKMFNVALAILNKLVNKSYEFVYRFIKHRDGHIALLSFFGNEKLVRFFNDQHIDSINYLLMNVSYLSKFVVENATWDIWHGAPDLNIIENLFKFRLMCSLSSYKNESDKRLFIEMINSIISNQSTDRQIDNIAETKFNKIVDIVYSDNNVIKILLNNVQSILDNMKLKNGNCFIVRRKFILDLCLNETTNDENVKEFNIVYDKTSSAYLINKLVNLYRLSINSKAKLQIAEGIDLLKQVFYKCNDLEKIYALQILLQLSINERIMRSFISNDRDLLKCIQNVMDSNLVLKKELKQLCEQAMWFINNSNQLYYSPRLAMVSTPTSIGSANNLVLLSSAHGNKTFIESRLAAGLTGPTLYGHLSPSANKHIMISYHRKNREVCYGIKSELSKAGFNVWMDSSSTNDDRAYPNMNYVAKAIEKCYCMMVCLNEFYRQSIACQFEVRYALKLNKKIIPVVLEENYDLTIDQSNWLHILALKDKKPIRLINSDFQKFFVQLNSQLLNSNLEQLKGRSELIQSKPKLYKETITMRTPKVEDWTEQQITIWFHEAKIHSEIKKAFGKCNGAILKQLYKIRCETPEIFYQLLISETKNKVTLKDIAQFYFNLEELFKA